MIKEELIGMIKGQKSLKYTFWIYGILIGNIILSSVIFSTFYIDAINDSEYNTEIGTAIIILSFIFITIPICIGIWNSSNFYDGTKIWAILAKIFSVMSILYGSYASYNVYGSLKDLDLYPEALSYVDDLNKTLPKVSNNIRTEKVKFIDGSVVVTNKFLNLSVNDINTIVFEQTSKQLQKEIVCNDPDIRSVLDSYATLDYIYKDKNDKYIGEINFYYTDCIDEDKK